LDEVEAFLKHTPSVQAYLVDVRAEQSLSRQIAERSGIQHESPQVIIFQRGAAIWSASHDDITASEIARHVPG